MPKRLTAITLFDMAGDFNQGTTRLPIIGLALPRLALIGVKAKET